jgi:hypothetical protein
MLAISATAQTGTTVTNSNDGASGSVPVYTGSSTISNSPITVSGSNVGIGTGTTAPSAKLDVIGGPIMIGSSDFNPNAALHIISNNYGGWNRLTQMGPATPSTWALNLMASTDASFNAQWWSWGVNNNVWTIEPNWTFSGSTGFFINSSGNVGIGTPAPTYKLDVAGQIRSSSGGIVFPDGSIQTTAYKELTSGSNMINQVNGDVGIGTTEPASLFDVFGDASFGVPTWGGNSLGSDGKFQILTGGTSPIANRLVFGTDNTGWKMAISKNYGGTVTDLMTFQDNGNIGIGTTTPQANLHIQGVSPTLRIGDTHALDPGQYVGVLGSLIFGAHYDVEADAKIYTYDSSVYSEDLRFATGSYNSASDRMTILSTGNVGIGTTSPGEKLEVSGNIKLTANGGSVIFQDGTKQSTAYTGITCGGDYAESVNVTGDRKHYEPGDVLVLDADNPGKILKSAEAYSTSVSGIYSTKPGTVGRRQTTPKSSDELPMAVVGIVPAKVSAENGPIKVGDLLVTSSTPGYAMKGTDCGRMLGAVVGKAMAKLDSGTGVIEVLVTLQ